MGGVHSVPCSCGDVYIGTTKRSVSERSRCCRLKRPEKSEVAENALSNADHRLSLIHI